MASNPKIERQAVKKVNTEARKRKSEMHPGLKMAEKNAHLSKAKALEKKVGHALKVTKRIKERY